MSVEVEVKVPEVVTDATLVGLRAAAGVDPDFKGRMQAASLDGARPTPPSCWSRFVNYCCQKTAPQAQKVASVAQSLSAASSQATQGSCFNSFWSFISWPVRQIHKCKAAAVTTVLSGISVGVSATVFPHYPVAALVSCLALGYLGQTTASKISEVMPDEDKKVATVIRRFQQHTSLATMMVTGYFGKAVWAQDLNCVLAGMLVRLKIEQVDDLKNFPTLQIELEQESVSLNPSTARGRASQNSCCQKIVSVFQKIAPALVAVASAALFISGLTSMYSYNLANANRALTWSIAFAEYGLKGLCALLGYGVERLLEANKGKPAFAKIHSILSKIEGISIGFSIYAHQVLPTNVQAFGFVAPMGYFLGQNMSRMLRINALEDKLLALRSTALLANDGNGDVEANGGVTSPRTQVRPGCTRWSFFTHALAASAFIGSGVYFLLKGSPDTVGLEVFFLVTPAFYYISRFVFSKHKCQDSSWRKAGHFLFHKSSQVMSEQLNWALSDVRAHAIAQTVTNAQIFFVFQGLLFGGFVEAPLFAIDEEEDIAEAEESTAIQRSERRLLLKKIRAEITRNFARMDLITISVFNIFKPRVQ